MNKQITADDTISKQVVTGDYSTWTEAQLVNEITSRHLLHGVSIVSFPNEQARMSRLIEILEGNDSLRSYLKKVAKRCMK